MKGLRLAISCPLMAHGQVLWGPSHSFDRLGCHSNTRLAKAQESNFDFNTPLDPCAAESAVQEHIGIILAQIDAQLTHR